MTERSACLLANHGMISIGTSFAEAMWRTIELETIARQYCFSLLIGGPALLGDAEVDDTMTRFSLYGMQDDTARKRKRKAKRHRR